MIREMLRPLMSFLDQEGLQELVINRPGELFCLTTNGWQRHEIGALSQQRLMTICLAIATFAAQSLSAQTPILSAVLPGGERIQILIPPCVEEGLISLSIRRPYHSEKTLKEWEGDGAFEKIENPKTREGRQENAFRESLLDELTRCVRQGENIAIVGETGSGKTTLMKSLCQLIPSHERLITIEDAREIFLPHHQNRVHLLYSRGNQGSASIDAGDLITACLRMRPDRVLLAELRGPEAFDYLKLLSTGHRGSITSFHAGSCAQAMDRFALMCRENKEALGFTTTELCELARLNIDLVVHLSVARGNGDQLRRFIKEIWRRLPQSVTP